MRIVDAHAHVFPNVQGKIGAGPTRGLGYGRIQVGSEEIQLMPAHNEETVYTGEMMVANMDWAQVERAVLLQGTFYGACNDYAWRVAERYAERLLALAYVDPWRGDLEEQWEQVAGFVGVKMECSVQTGFLGWYPQARLDAAALSWFWAAVAESGKVLVLDLGHIGGASYQTEAVRKIATEYSAMTIVIAHLGQPSPLMEEDESLKSLWREQVELGKLANVYFDTAALPAYAANDAGEAFPYPSTRRWLQEAIEWVGCEKVMWGTDQPGLLGHANLPQLVRLAETQLDFLAPEERARVMGLNALEIFWGD